MTEWYTAQEAADVLNTRRQTIAEMVKKGKFRNVHWVGNQVRIHRSDLYPQVATVTPPNPDLGRTISEIRHRLDELEAMLRAS